MAKTKTPISEQERTERRETDREFAAAAVEQMRHGERWQTWLTVRARFRDYSVTNQILVAVQHPTATRVAGFRAWLSLGYAVKHGETGIRIWAPCPPGRKQIERWREQGSDPDRQPRTYFKLVAVFAQDQVGELPPPARPMALDPPLSTLTGDGFASALPALIALAGEIGSQVEFQQMNGERQGSYNTATKRITIRQDSAGNAQVKTLIHELAHALLRAEPADDDPDIGYASEELVVESVALTVTRALGLDSSRYSIPYLTSWAQAAPLETIERTARVIDRIAARIEHSLVSAEKPAQAPCEP